VKPDASLRVQVGERLSGESTMRSDAMRLAGIPTLAVLALTCGALSAVADPDPAPGGIVLPQGYRHVTMKGDDSRVGRISNDAGVEISYDIGELAGDYTKQIDDPDRAWTRTYKNADRAITIVKDKKGRVTASIVEVELRGRHGSPANFLITPKTDADLADFLLMLFSYRVW
jgi:hypothetical protein